MELVKKNKKGSVTVFICIFFVTLVFLILTFVSFAKKEAVSSGITALNQLWADSVLAEYDLNLQKRYNIFGFYGYPSDVKDKLTYYADQSLHSKKYISYQVTGCSLYDYALTNTQCLEEQLVKAGKLAFTEKFIKPEEEIKSIQSTDVPAEKEAGYQSPDSSQVFKDLPSEGSPKSYSLSAVMNLLSGKASVGESINQTGKNWWVNQYLFAYFKDALDRKNLGQTYLQNEIEYIICGEKSDSANAAAIRRRIIAVREAMNLLYLSKDVKKQAAAAAAAQLLTPGPMAAATKAAILAAWALAESGNDYKLLIRGLPVPMMKTQASWAVDLDSVINNTAEGYIDTGCRTGDTYQDYLKLFSCTMDSSVRLLRIMDVIQINMRSFYYDSFLLRDYNGGVRFVTEVNGAEYETIKTY